MNVLGKVVVPKTKATCAYIISALEELARDEFYRRKMIIDVKKKIARMEDVEEKEPPEIPEVVEEGKPSKLEESHVSLVSKSDNKMDQTSLLNSLKDNISEILQKVNTMDEALAETVDIEECLAIGEDLKNKLDASLKSDSVCCSELASIRSNISETNKTIVTMESSEKILPLEQFYSPGISNYGTFSIVVKESTRVERTLNEDGTVKEEKKIVRVKKIFKRPDGQNLTPHSTSSSTISSNDTISNTSRETSASKSSKSPKTTIQMLTVSHWLNEKLRDQSTLDLKLWAEQIYGETSNCHACVHFDNLSLRRHGFPTMDGKRLKFIEDSSPNSVPEDSEDLTAEMHDPHNSFLNCNEECVENNVIEHKQHENKTYLPLELDKDHISQISQNDNENGRQQK